MFLTVIRSVIRFAHSPQRRIFERFAQLFPLSGSRPNSDNALMTSSFIRTLRFKVPSRLTPMRARCRSRHCACWDGNRIRGGFAQGCSRWTFDA